jgi:hypothetical protein
LRGNARNLQKKTIPRLAFRVWRAPAATLNFKEKIFDPRLWTVANHADPLYLGLVLVGAALSLLSLGALLFFTWRSHRVRSAEMSS